MLSFNSKCRYGIVAVMALAENYNQGLLQIKDIASSKNIPEKYLVQIFNLLIKADIVHSVRGSKGGYKLAQDPARITALSVIETLEGGISLAGNLQEQADVVFALFRTVENQLRQNLNITLADLLLQQQAMNKNVMYHI